MASLEETFQTAQDCIRLGAKSQGQEVSNTLLYCLGEESDDVLTSTNVTVDKR